MIKGWNQSEDEIKIEKPNKIEDIVETILVFNGRNQIGKGLTMTPNQMPVRLAITLAQLQSENNLLKLKNEIRQLLYSLYCSKKITKLIYSGLMKSIQKWR